MTRRTARLAAAALVLMSLLHTWGCASERKEEPLQRMSLEQKAGQMLMVGFDGKALTPEIEELIRTVQPGGVILFGRNIESAEQLKTLVDGLQALSRELTGLPLFVAIDQEGGNIVRARWLDDAVSQKGITGTDQAYRIGLARAQGLKDVGVNLNLAPVLDLGVEGDFLEKYGRTFQGNPEKVGELGAGVISGQKEGGIFSTAKHFPGYGGVTSDPENDRLPMMTEIPVIRQFQVAAAAGPEFVMTANVVYTPIDGNLPFPLTPRGIRYLHEQLPGDYLVISDDLATKVLKEAFTLGRTVTLAAAAGVEVLLIAGHEPGDVTGAFEALCGAMLRGEVGEEEADAALEKILTLKQRISLWGQAPK